MYLSTHKYEMKQILNQDNAVKEGGINDGKVPEMKLSRPADVVVFMNRLPSVVILISSYCSMGWGQGEGDCGCGL